MIAKIDSNGKLSIIPETELEDFALQRWCDDYMREDGIRFAVLELVRYEFSEDCHHDR